MLNRRRQGLPIDVDDEIAKNILGLAIVGGVVTTKYFGDKIFGDDLPEGVRRINGNATRNMDPQEKQLFYDSGQSNYSINVNGYNFQYGNLIQPLSTMIGLATDYTDLVVDGWNDKLELSAFGMAHSILLGIPSEVIAEQTFGKQFKLLTTLLDGNDDAIKRATGELNRSLSGFAPIGFASAARGIARAIDRPDDINVSALRRMKILEGQERIDNRSMLGGAYDTLKPGLIANIPPNPYTADRSDLLPVFTTWGDIVTSPQGVISRIAESMGAPPLAVSLIDAMADPTSMKKLTENRATKEVIRLRNELDKIEFPPGVNNPLRGFDDPDPVLGYLGEITTDQYIEYVQESGRRAEQAVLLEMKKPSYTRWDNPMYPRHKAAIEQAERLSGIRMEAKRRVAKEMFGVDIKIEKKQWKNYLKGMPSN